MYEHHPYILYLKSLSINIDKLSVPKSMPEANSVSSDTINCENASTSCSNSSVLLQGSLDVLYFVGGSRYSAICAQLLSLEAPSLVLLLLFVLLYSSTPKYLLNGINFNSLSFREASAKQSGCFLA